MKLLNYELDIIEISDFKNYYHEHINNFTGTAKNAFLKALDIPPKFFKEQPEETQEELLDNREYFVAEHKKYFDKVIVIVKSEFGDILNACRMDRTAANSSYDKLKTIEEVPNKFEHRAFIKDGYTSVVLSKNNGLKKGEDNKVIVIDFPVLLNKKPVIHQATYRIPDDSFITPVEHIHYFTNNEVAIQGDEAEFNNIKEAVEEYKHYLEDDIEKREDKPVLREHELVSLALVEGKVIPKGGRTKVEDYLKKHAESGLTTNKLEKLLLDFDETFTGYKQVLNLRNINGNNVLEMLESEEFKAFAEEMEEEL